MKERSFLEKTWEFRDAGKGKTEILPADNYEFPFDVVLPGTLPESVEGLQDAWVAYRFKAEIGRKYAKDIHVRKPLRIIRTLSPAALELAHTMVSWEFCSISTRSADTYSLPSRLRTCGPTRLNTQSRLQVRQ